jgi:GlpG protein
MRLIGHLNNGAGARTFGDYLTSLQIGNAVELDADGAWAIWVLSEDQLETSQRALTDYLANPNDGKYWRASEKAAAMKAQELKEKAEFAKRIVTKDALWTSYALGPLTLVLIGACVAVALLLGLPPTSAPYLWLSAEGSPFLPEVRQGEIWRLLTPIFIHMNIFHILFNMLWLKDLGSLIETRQGAGKLLVLVVVIGVGSNLGQDFVAGPIFGGMSGVLYGLFGYIWMRGKFDPASGLRLSPTDIVMMVGWFFLCLFHFIPGVANGAHGFGLVMGMIWGAGPPLVKKLWKV